MFLDVDDIPTGSDFRAYIRQTILGSDAVMVIIGPRWLESFRLADPERPDNVLIELEVALEQGVPMIPVLIGNTPMPPENTLPASISQVSFRNAFALDAGPEFEDDFNRLISHLDALRMGQGQGHKHHADYRLAQQSCWAILDVFKTHFPYDAHPFGINMKFRVYSTNEFHLPMNTGISLFLHRIVQDSTSLVELHVILTAWGFSASVQHLVIGWVVEYLKRHPILPVEKTDESQLDAIPPGVTLRVFPSSENPREIWRSITDKPYQISASYVLRVLF